MREQMPLRIRLPPLPVMGRGIIGGGVANSQSIRV